MRILHISDIQMGFYGIKEDFKTEYGDDYLTHYKEFLQKIEAQFISIHKNSQVDVIVISGDLVSKGKKDEYIEVETDFLPILKKVFFDGENPILKNIV